MNGSNFETLLKSARKIPPVRIAIAGPAKSELLQISKRVQDEGIAELTLIGDTAWVIQLGERVGLNITKAELIHETQLDLTAAQLAVEEAKKGKVQLLMNGFVSSKHMLQAAMDLQTGISTYRFFSQLTALELPGFSKLLFIADTGIHSSPRVMETRDILINTLEYLRKLGMEKVRIVVLKATPTIEMDESIQKEKNSSVEIPHLMDLKERFPELELLEQMSMAEAMIGEPPDVFLTPSGEAGQGLSQALCAFAGGKAGNIILGGKVPLVLTANNPTEEHLWRSILMALQLCPMAKRL